MFDIGVDIIEVERIKSAIEKLGDKFLNRVYSKNEIEYCKKNKNPYPSYAVRFAAKEAYIKFIGKQNIKLVDIEVKNGEHGKPFLMIKGEKKENLKISLSHTHQYAIAMLVGIDYENS